MGVSKGGGGGGGGIHANVNAAKRELRDVVFFFFSLQKRNVITLNWAVTREKDP